VQAKHDLKGADRLTPHVEHQGFGGGGLRTVSATRMFNAGEETGVANCRRSADGLEAVHKAEELQPDLILLDIGLPRLNGIEAARRIRKLSPMSRILFMSQESSADVVQVALNLGAVGYIAKVDAGSELLAAVEAAQTVYQ
jgi:DNA-binding NarL/FixJ family response regulator